MEWCSNLFSPKFTPRGASSYVGSLPYYGGGTYGGGTYGAGNYPYGSNSIGNCHDTCNWEAGMMGLHIALSNSPCFIRWEKIQRVLWQLWIPKFVELYCDGDGGGGGSGYYDGYDDNSYYGNGYDDDAIVTGRTRYGYNRWERQNIQNLCLCKIMCEVMTWHAWKWSPCSFKEITVAGWGGTAMGHTATRWTTSTGRTTGGGRTSPTEATLLSFTRSGRCSSRSSGWRIWRWHNFQVLPEDRGTYHCEVEGGRNYGRSNRKEVRFYPRQPNLDSICRWECWPPKDYKLYSLHAPFQYFRGKYTY